MEREKVNFDYTKFPKRLVKAGWDKAWDEVEQAYDDVQTLKKIFYCCESFIFTAGLISLDLLSKIYSRKRHREKQNLKQQEKALARLEVDDD